MSRSPPRAVDSQTPLGYINSLDELVRLVESGMSHSGRERNCCFLNTGGGRFATVSAVSGIDFPDDARAIAPVDWDHDGDVDLWLTCRTGPQVRLLCNRAGDGRASVALRLVGRAANRDGIGARVRIEFENRRGAADENSTPLVKTLHAGDGFLAQGSKWLHFGLEGAPEIKCVIVRWPGGREEAFTGAKAGGRFRLVQGSGAAQSVESQRREINLPPARLDAPAATAQARIWLTARPPMPQLAYDELPGREETFSGTEGRPLLLNLWATWCAPCGRELKSIAERAKQFERQRIDVLALSVDALDRRGADSAEIRGFADRLPFPFAVGLARGELVEKMEILCRKLMGRHIALPVPTSFLIDADGRLAAIYLGAVDVDTLLDDAGHLQDDPEQRRAHGDPMAGTWFTYPRGLQWDGFAEAYLRVGHPGEAVRVLEEALAQNANDVPAQNLMGEALLALGDTKGAAARFRTALTDNPAYLQARFNLGVALAQQDRHKEAIAMLRQAIEIAPRYADAHFQLAQALRRQGEEAAALAHLRRARRLSPHDLQLMGAVAWVLATAKDEKLRRPDEAIALAESACRLTGGASPELLDTLAAAQAAGGEFEAAIRTATEALRLATTGEDDELSEEIQARLRRYRTGRAYVE